MKRVLSIVLALVLVLAMASCTQNTPASSSSTAPAPISSQAAVVAPETPADKDIYPLEGAPEFTYWVQLHANISPFANDFGETDLAKNWMEATGVKLRFEHPSGTGNDQMLEALNIMFASGKYADMIHFDWSIYPGGVDKLYNDGIIYSLNDTINEWMPNLAARLASDDTYYKLAKSDDGAIYKVPMLMDGPLLTSTSGPMVRADLMEKHGIKEVPETIADWDAYLEAIKDDVETPFIIQYSDLSGTWARAWGVVNAFQNDDGVVSYGPVQPAYKEYLANMNDWYKRGLFDRNFTTTNRQAVDAAMASGTAGATRGSGGQQLGAYIPLIQANIPGADLIPAPFPVVNKGDMVKHNNNWLIKNTGNVAITKNVSEANLEYVAKFLDYMYGEEGNILGNYGIEGLTFDFVNGEPTYSDFIMNPTNGKTMAQEMSNQTFANWNGPFVQNEPYLVQYYALPQQKEALVQWNKIVQDSRDLSKVTPTAEEASEFGRLYNDIKSYADECTQLFIIGDKSLDEFDKFVSEIESMNLARCIEIQQGALARFEAR